MTSAEWGSVNTDCMKGTMKELETDPDPPDPQVLEEWRSDWPG
jgi:hypothetical protein